jgi:hypothetical protein
MQQVLNHPPIGASDFELNPSFSVVIAYEDFETGKQAKKTCDGLEANLGRHCNFNAQMWKFEVLSIPKLRELAAKDAAMADIIIISCHAREDLPVEVKAWTELWLSEKSNPIALVALFSGAPEEADQAHFIRSYLDGVAKRGQMEFFSQPGDRPGDRNLFSTSSVRLAPRPDLSITTLSTIASVAQRDLSFPRWGINE